MSRTPGWALVAGSTGLVGTVVAEGFARQGVNLVLHSGRRLKAAASQGSELEARFGVRYVPLAADVTSETALATARCQAQARGVRHLDALVNCATGYDGRPVDMNALDATAFRRVIDVDLVGSYLLVRAFLPMLRQAGAARVVLLSSLAGVRGRPAAPHLCAAKAGIAGLALGLSRDLAEAGISVNVVAPGPIQNPDAEPLPLPPGMPASAPEEVAATVLMLADTTRRLAGQVIIVNGGQP
jgi:NAD(P)-dependent dehydrogenase (short-subunit alcohol dehydrogenase family)